MSTTEPTANAERPSHSAGATDDYNHEQSQTYVELAKMSQESFFNRRSYEWKVAFGLWAAIGLITYFTIDRSASFDRSVVTALGWVYSLIGLSWLVFWQLPLRIGFEQDKEFKHYYMHRAEGFDPPWPGDNEITLKDLFTREEREDKKTDVLNDERSRRRKFSFRRTAWTLGQTIFTIAFLIGSWVAISSAVSQPSSNSSKLEVKASGGTVKLQTEASK